jgi:hypothetical protein
MKTLRDQEEVKEVEPKDISEEKELGEEGQEDVITFMSKVTWLETFHIQGGHGALIVEPMGTQLKTAHN